MIIYVTSQIVIIVTQRTFLWARVNGTEIVSKFTSLHMNIQIFISNNPPTHYSHPFVDSSSPTAAYMRQWTGSALVQLMVCRYCQLDPQEQISMKSHQNKKLSIHKNAFKNGGHFVQGYKLKISSTLCMQQWQTIRDKQQRNTWGDMCSLSIACNDVS